MESHRRIHAEQRCAGQERRAREEWPSAMAIEQQTRGDHADSDAAGEGGAEQTRIREIEAEVARQVGLVGTQQHQHEAEAQEGGKAEGEQRAIAPLRPCRARRC